MIGSVGLPTALTDILRRNLERGANIESDRTINDYVQSAVLASAIRILSYMLCAFAVYIALALVISLFNYVFHFPLVRGIDGLVAAGFGAARGAMLLALIFLLVPLMMTAIPLDMFRNFLSGSVLASHFMNTSFFTGIYFS